MRNMEVDRIRTIAVIGFGTIGTGVAQFCAQKGYHVIAVDLNNETLSRGVEIVRRGRFGLEAAVGKGKISIEEASATLSRITTTTKLEDAAKEADFVIENVYEDLDLKRKLFKELDTLCRPQVVLATDTSSISITRIASLTETPERVLGMHFFNPAQVMQLVEVISGLLTSERARELTRQLAIRLGKIPIMVKDAPGFAAARLGLSLFVEASRVLEEGVASMEAIDTAMKLGFGHPMGPFELTDLIGLDTRLSILEEMYEATGDGKWMPPRLLRQLVEARYLGDPKLKQGSRGGYYSYFEGIRQKLVD